MGAGVFDEIVYGSACSVSLSTSYYRRATTQVFGTRGLHDHENAVDRLSNSVVGRRHSMRECGGARFVLGVSFEQDSVSMTMKANRTVVANSSKRREAVEGIVDGIRLWNRRCAALQSWLHNECIDSEWRD